MLTNPRIPFAVLAVLSLGVIGFVLFSQYVQYYEPCELCLRERLPWYATIALALAGVAFPSRWMLIAIGLVLLVGAGLGLHHSGVEQHWWPGPTECTSGSSGAGSVEELRKMMMRAKTVQCDAIAWTLFGISMATFNFLRSRAAGAATLVYVLRIRHAR
jgi:disulfide bond formation protein DsbB